MENSIFQIQAEELEKAFNRIEEMEGEEKAEFLMKCSELLPIIERMVQYGMWSQYDLLGKYKEDVRLDDVARGGLNALFVLLEHFQKRKAEYDDFIKENQKGDFDPHSPINVTEGI